MFIFKIFQIRKQAKDAIEAGRDPVNFSKNQLKGMLWASLIPTIIGGILILGLLFILGFTSLIGGPFGLARGLFIFIVVGLLLLSGTAFLFWRRMKRFVQNNQPKSQQFDYDVDPKQ